MSAPTFPDILATRDSPGKEVQNRTLEAKYGDGYVQRAGDGINPQIVMWDLTWTNVDITDINEIAAFLDAREGVYPFYWTAPDESDPALWVCTEGYKKSAINALSATLTAKFSRWYGATP